MQDGGIIVCRCEDVTLSEIRNAIARGFVSPEEVKRFTRCGMGPCQGRTCRDLLMAETVRAAAKNSEEIKLTTIRPPVKPLQLKKLLRVE